MLDWLRLFETTSFYVTLISKTIIEIIPIGFIIIVILLYSGCAMFMLQLNAAFGEENYIIHPVSENFLADSFLNQYLLMLGEFYTDGFKAHANTGLLWVLFISMTFISQLTFLNMLIAIMGDTFDRVMEQRPTYSLKNRLKLMASMKSIIERQAKEDETKVFLYVIEPV